MVIQAAQAKTTTEKKTEKTKTEPATLEKKEKVLYLNNEEIGKTYQFKVKNLPKGTTCEWSSSKKSVAVINKISGKATAKAVGSTTITCKISKKSKLVQTLKGKVTVRANAETVQITNIPEQNKVQVGSRTTFSYEAKTAQGKKATDKVIWLLSDNTAQAKADETTGTVVAEKEGSYTITAYAYQNNTKKAAKQWSAQSAPVTIHVIDNSIQVKQTSINTVEVSWNSSLTGKVTKENVSLYDAQTMVALDIDTLSLSADGKTMTIKSYLDFVNGTTYTVQYDGKKVNFVAKSSDVAKVVLQSQKVQAAEPTTINYHLYDANGVDVTKADADITFESDQGLIEGNKITLYAIGDTAKVKAAYHTGKYNALGEEVLIKSQEVVFTAVEKVEKKGKLTDFTIAKDGPNWDKKSSQVPLESEGYMLYVRGTDSNGEEIDSISDAADFTFESTNNEIVLVNTDGSLYPIKLGTAYIKVSYGETKQTYKVTVVAERHIANVRLSRNSVVLSNKLEDRAEIQATAYDQYNEEMEAKDLTVYPESTTSKANSPVAQVENGKVILQTIPNVTTPGNYRFIVSVSDRKAYITVTVKTTTASQATNYKVETDTSLDVTPGRSTTPSVQVKVYGYANGVRIEDVTGKVSLIVKTPDGNTLLPSMTTLEKLGQIVQDKNKNNAVFYGWKKEASGIQVLKEGTYTLTASGVAAAPAQIKVLNQVAKPTVSAKSTVTNYYSTINDLVQDCFTIRIGSNKVEKENIVVSEKGFSAPSSAVDSNGFIVATQTYSVVIKSLDITYMVGKENYHTTIIVNKGIKVIVK